MADYAPTIVSHHTHVFLLSTDLHRLVSYQKLSLCQNWDRLLSDRPAVALIASVDGVIPSSQVDAVEHTPISYEPGGLLQPHSAPCDTPPPALPQRRLRPHAIVIGAFKDVPLALFVFAQEPLVVRTSSVHHP